MKTWITRNIWFGYKYTSSQWTRRVISSYFDDYLIPLLSSKAATNDVLVIAGGLFSSTNPSVVAISDARRYLSTIASIMKVVLLSSPKDVRLFDGEYYSAYSIFDEHDNISVRLSESEITISGILIDAQEGIITISNKELPIPYAIQFEENMVPLGLFVQRQDGKYKVIQNSHSPRHITVEITQLDELKALVASHDILHIIIDKTLYERAKGSIDVELFRLKPATVSYVGESDTTRSHNSETASIVEKIYHEIGDDDKLKGMFDKIVRIRQRR